jgi:hypothetical protein
MALWSCYVPFYNACASLSAIIVIGNIFSIARLFGLLHHVKQVYGRAATSVGWQICRAMTAIRTNTGFAAGVSARC